MARSSIGPQIENPTAYANAIERRIKHNRWTTARRKLLALLEQEPPLFTWWLLGYDTPELAAMSQHMYDIDDSRFDEEAAGRYDSTCVAMRKAYGRPAAFLEDALEQWGGLTERQYAFAKRSFLEKTQRNEEREAERAAQRATAEDAPTGRLVVEGEVVKVDVQHNDFGTRVVMTVRTVGGWMAWGSVPSSSSVARGDRVRFTATVEPSQKDPKFAFYKRPAKLEVEAA